MARSANVVLCIYIYIYISLTVAVLMQGPQKACRVLVGSSFEASWGLFWPLLGPVLGLLGGWGLLGASVGVLGDFRAPFWRSLGPSWAPLGPSWGPLGRSWGALGGLLGRLGVVLGASWAVLERRKGEKARKPKTYKNLREINDFGLLGPSWEGSWGSLGTSWRPLGPS